ncbi:hypothetical protein MATR_26800 [Marivirga tractuosa]|uniref:Uncharacterized protein n=1 Tax=Marivirga tractuosa (strain ATCC 23168 / DSM 4126 / NBRC 15989 / NCIMB 1408 / VKM B-1430 / H-43) TaxID=643867 RepID=E4TN80_MARTH|nr:hypothetical protein Ftrac_3496 [Marivirga tractuosa DSM 4126]BDD15855.1 hypothetical protein MATR_26800 [Marivirga tractuosa]
MRSEDNFKISLDSISFDHENPIRIRPSFRVYDEQSFH